MTIPASFEAMLKHPAPGFHFPPHEHAGIDACILPVKHRVGRPATPAAIETLIRLTAKSEGTQAQLLDLYQKYDGVELCCSPDVFNGGEAPALCILPVEEWEPQAAYLLSDDLSWLFDGLEDMYKLGDFLVIAANDNEHTRLVLFTAGTHDGEALAGKIFCVAMDPVLGFTEVLAHSFHDMLDMFAQNPASFLEKIGYCSTVQSESGTCYGAVADAYLPDIRGGDGVARKK